MIEVKRMKSKRRTQLHNGGFTLIEFIVVIAILAAAVSIGSAGFSAVYNARAKKAASGLDNVFAECKVFNLSGRSCYARIEFDSTHNEYVASVVKDNGTEDDRTDDVVLESVVLGNRLLNITTHDGTGVSQLTSIEVKFRGDTGAVAYCNAITAGTAVSLMGADTASEQFTLEGGGTYVLTLYHKTGMHSFKKGSAV